MRQDTVRHCALLALLLLCALPDFGQSTGSAAASPCARDKAYSRLDFWLGDWLVVDSSGAVVGSASLDKILGGCAIQYRWRDPDGSETLELFYYVLAAKQWRQLLLSDSGRTMERTLVEESEKSNRVRFQGKAQRLNGSPYFDRSTITPLGPDEIHQVIERSLDGSDWRVAFDAHYKRRSRSSSGGTVDPAMLM